MSRTEHHTAAKPTLRPRIEGDREAEILDATLRMLSTAGYDRLTMDAVAAAAKASKATLYRRWSTKADLVIDAIARAKGAPQVLDANTGTLRGDLMVAACHKGGLNDASTMSVLAGIISALHHDAEFAAAFHERFIIPKVAETRAIYARAQGRGEIADDVDLDLLAPVLAAIILHRSFVLQLPTDDATVGRIIDDIVIPAATHHPCSSLPTTTSD
jgi:AcrR family transcriptional regulator